MKKVIIGIVAVIIIAVVVNLGYFLVSNNNEPQEKENNTPTNPTVIEPTEDIDKRQDDITKPSNGKTLVVYFSASGSTKKVAEQVADNLNAELFEIEPINPYTSSDLDWTDNNSRVTKEHEDESLRDIKLKNTKVDTWDSYDTVLIGYQIWWGIAAWPVDTFVKANDFNGKTVIPFCTSASSGLGQSGDLLKQEAKGGNWVSGHRFSSGASSSDIKTWTDGLKQVQSSVY